jgi:hypothetical protein
MNPPHALIETSRLSRRNFLRGSAAAGAALLSPGTSSANAAADQPPADGMYGLIYFDTEDFVSPPDSPTHTLPGQLADIMRKHGLQGCFHIHGERARYWERHAMTRVIDQIRWHDVSLHYDRGSIHPTTAEEVSELDWFRGVDRVLFRELPGFQALQRIFGKCSALTQHGGTFAAQIVYAAGKMGKPFFYSPFGLPGRNVVWFCNNLLIGGYQAPFYFDQVYRDTPRFEQNLAQVNGYLDQRARSVDFTAMFGCHPVIAIAERFPDAINFAHGAAPAPKDWIAPRLVPGVSIPRVLQNFERLIVTLVNHPRVKWTTVAGIHERYGQRPVRVTDAEVLRGAQAIVRQGGPAWISTLSAAELFVLLAQRAVAPAKSYEVPHVMGPTEVAEPGTVAAGGAPDIARQVLDAAFGSGYLPPVLKLGQERIALERGLLALACHATGKGLPPEDQQRTLDAMPGVADAIVSLKRAKKWSIHGPRYHPEEILKHFRLQCWTLKPAFRAHEYAPEVEISRDLNPMFEGRG